MGKHLDLDDVTAGHPLAEQELALLRAAGDAGATSGAKLDTAAQYLEAIHYAINECCTCGGGEPSDCCGACSVWYTFVAAMRDHGEDHSGER